MANSLDKARKDAKAREIIARLAEIHDSRELLIGMMDERQLDMLILALGLGAVMLNDEIDT